MYIQSLKCQSNGSKLLAQMIHSHTLLIFAAGSCGKWHSHTLYLLQVLVENGTSAGFSLINEARDHLLEVKGLRTGLCFFKCLQK